MCSSSMILRKCRTENPAISAAFGISRKTRFDAHPTDDFMCSLLGTQGVHLACQKRKAGSQERMEARFPFWLLTPGFWLLVSHKRVSVIGRRYEGLFDRAGAD